MNRTLIALIACSLLVGCAIGPVPTHLAEPVTPLRWADALPGTGTLIVKRDNEMTGSTCKFRMLIDNVEVGTLRIREKLELHLPPGEHLVSGHCQFVSPVETLVTIETDKTKTYRISALPSGLLATSIGFTIQPTAY